MKIRLLTKEDLPQRVEWMNNSAVYKTMHFTPPISLEKPWNGILKTRIMLHAAMSLSKMIMGI